MRGRYLLGALVAFLLLQLPDPVDTQWVAVRDSATISRRSESIQKSGGHSTSQSVLASVNAGQEQHELYDLENAAADASLPEIRNSKAPETVKSRKETLLHSKGKQDLAEHSSSSKVHILSRANQTPRLLSKPGSRASSDAFRHSITGIASHQGQGSDKIPNVSVRDEEEKLRNATIKLVIWLRNRLQKRLNDVAMLENEMQTEKIVLVNLNETISNKRSERESEIRAKIKTQKKLSEVRLKVDLPEKQLLAVQAETKKLSDHLAQIGETYEVLAEKRRRLRQKLYEAGFSHWLDMRGKEYLPDTAIGVLSKSVELLKPFSRDLQRAVNVDRKLAESVEGLLPNLLRWSLMGETLEEFLMLLPMIPIILVVCRLFQKLYTLSILRLVMYGAISFMLEFLLLLLVSAILGREFIGALQETRHSMFLTAFLFTNVLTYVGYMLAQALISVLEGSRFEMIQSILSAAVGYYYYWGVFRPVMVDEAVRITTVGHLMSFFIFCLVAFKKKNRLKIQAPFEDEMNEMLLSFEVWTWETVDAMNNMFRDRQYSSGATLDDVNKSFGSKTPTDTLSARCEKVASILKPRLSSPSTLRRGYGRWSGARVATGIRNHNTRGFNVPHRLVDLAIVHSGSRLRTPIMHSESRTSTVYGSCAGD